MENEQKANKPQIKRQEVQLEPKRKKDNPFKRFFAFLKRHKVATIIIVVVVAILVSGILFVNHYLNKINFESREDLSTKFTILELKTGEKIDVTGLTLNSDGTYTLPDGRRIDSDGTIWNTDGSIVFYDGSYLLTDGTAVLSDGTTIYTNSNVVFQDGYYIKNSGIKVSKDGYATFKNGKKAHITAFTITKDGKIQMKPGSLISSKYDASGTFNIDPDDDESKIKSQKSKLKSSDDAIKRNFDDKRIWYSDDILNILVMGIDEGSKSYPFGRSDSMILLSINKNTKKVKMISLSRAAYVAIRGHENTRLNHAHGFGGPELAIDTIERNYKIRIDNYVSTNFDTFKEVIDAIGGINMKLTAAEAKALKSKIKANGLEYKGEGKYKLNGQLALEYVRLRKIDTDRERTGRQRKILMAIINRAKSMSINQLLNMANKVLPLINTDMTKSEILSQLMYVSSYLGGDIKQYVVPNKPTKLTLVDDFEVLLLDWGYEIPYLHDIIYEGVTPKYVEK